MAMTKRLSTSKRAENQTQVLYRPLLCSRCSVGRSAAKMGENDSAFMKPTTMTSKKRTPRMGCTAR